MNQITYLNELTAVNDYFKTSAPKQMTDEEYCINWFGSNYLGNGFVKCDYCKEEPVKIKGYFEQHVCQECQKELN